MAVVHGVADPVGEVDAVPQPLLPVVDVVDHLAGPDVAALVHGGEVTDLERTGLDALQFGSQLTEQWIHLLGVAGAFGLELAGEFPLLLAALDDRVDLGGRAADHGLGRCGVDAHLQVREIGEHLADLVGGVLHQRHQSDVLAEQHRFTLAHQMGSGADGPGGIGQRQPTGEVGRSRLPQRLPHHRGGLGAVVTQQFTEGDLDGEDDHLHHFDRVLAGLVGVVDRVVEDQFDDRVAALVLNQGVDLVDPLGEHLVAQVEALAHLAVLRAEAGEDPDRSVGHRAVGAEHQWGLFAFGDRAQTLDGFVVVACHHHCAGAAVVAPRERPADRLQRGGPALRAVHPVRQFGGSGPLAGGQKTRNSQRHNGLEWFSSFS